jgi:uncharacterized protein YdhG (YjbR/CyaY superfamily)
MTAQKSNSPANLRKPKQTDAEHVERFMHDLEHPLKAEIEAVREIIKNTDEKIRERIKWNAPSYYTTADLLTFNPRLTTRVHLIFHNIAIVDVKSDLLEGIYKDRRMTYFDDMADVIAKKPELVRVLQELIMLAEK